MARNKYNSRSWHLRIVQRLDNWTWGRLVMVGSVESVPGKVMESVIMKGLGALDTEGPDQLF